MIWSMSNMLFKGGTGNVYQVNIDNLKLGGCYAFDKDQNITFAKIDTSTEDHVSVEEVKNLL